MECDKNSAFGLHLGIWAWYDYSKMEKVLFIDGKEEEFADVIDILPQNVICMGLVDSLNKEWTIKNLAAFDCIISIAGIERCENPVEVLLSWKKILKPDGKMMLGMNNRFGLRYFCGDRDPYTDRNFDGIEGYQHVSRKSEDIFNGRMYSKSEIKNILRNAGLDKCRFFSVLPDLDNCTLLYDENTIPKEDLSNRLFATYNYPDTVFLEERELYDGVIENGMFHQMANAYLVECSLKGDFSDVIHVTASTGREKEYVFFTLLHKNDYVEKRAVYSEGQKKLQQLVNNMEQLQKQGISVVEGHIKDNRYVMPYISGENGLVYLERLLRNDMERFYKELDRFLDLVLKSSEIEKEDIGDGNGAILRYGYLDMVPWNSFYKNGEFVFFDQEFCQEHYPVNMIFYRIMIALQGMATRVFGEKMLPDFLLRRYGLIEKRDEWARRSRVFLDSLVNRPDLQHFYAKHRHNDDVIKSNRHHMNYSADKYQKMFIDIFHNVDSRKLLIWGSGKFAEKFMAIYRDDYPVYKIVDNQSARWGQKLDGVEIVSPDFLKKLDQNEYKVIICMKNYVSVMKQLEGMEVTEYSIYDATREYQRKFKPIIASSADVDAQPKKYRIGYIAGVFDLFHVGHLNMFKRAKEQCHYLIVGVVSDEGVRKFKKVEPFVPCVERIEMIRSCRFVDQVVELPLYYADTWDVWKMYHFDVQFSGSDYEHNDYWLKKQEFLREQGADLVFFPYTESTSSTKLKKLIEKKLL